MVRISRKGSVRVSGKFNCIDLSPSQALASEVRTIVRFATRGCIGMHRVRFGQVIAAVLFTGGGTIGAVVKAWP